MRLVGIDNYHGDIHWYDADNASGFHIHFRESEGGTYWLRWWDSWVQFQRERWLPDGMASYEDYIEVPNAAQAMEIATDWFEAFWLEGGF